MEMAVKKGSAESASGVMPNGMQPLGSMTIPGKPGRAQEASSTGNASGAGSVGSPPGMVPLGSMGVPTPPKRIGPAAGAMEDDGDGDAHSPRGAGNPV
jgi:hypothetical protein